MNKMIGHFIWLWVCILLINALIFVNMIKREELEDKINLLEIRVDELSAATKKVEK